MWTDSVKNYCLPDGDNPFVGKPEVSLPYRVVINHALPVNMNDYIAITDKPGERYVCRHIAAKMVEDMLHDDHGKMCLDNFRSVAILQKHMASTLPEADHLFKQLKHTAIGHYLFSALSFGMFLNSQVEEMRRDGQKQRAMLLHSDNHVMALSLRYKLKGTGDVFVVSLFDPNFTDSKVRFETPVSTSSAVLPSLSLRHFIPGRFYDLYFPDDEGLCVALDCVLDSKAAGPVAPELKAVFRDNDAITSMLLYFILANGYAGMTADIIEKAQSRKDRGTLLAARNAQNVPGLYMAMQDGHTDAVREFVNAVLASTLSGEEKVALLQARDTDGVPGLYMVIQKGHTDMVQAFVNAVLASALSREEKVALLHAHDTDGVPGLYMAMQSGHTDTVHAFVDAVLESGLTDKDKVTLLCVFDSDNVSGLAMAMQSGHADTVQVFIDAVQASMLSIDDKVALLRIHDTDGVIGLHMAMQNGHTDTVLVFVNAVLASTLSVDYQVMLLCARNSVGVSGLYKAYQEGHTDTVQMFVNAVQGATRSGSDKKVQPLIRYLQPFS